MNLVYYIEDDESIAGEVRMYLYDKGYEVITMDTVSEAKNKISRKTPILVLVDCNLPDGSGERLCRWIRSRLPELPVIFVTVKDRVNDIVEGFRIGADDYITKPFDLEVLYSRINALLRRSNGTADLLTCGMISLDKRKHVVMDDEKELALSALEYQLLVILMENKSRTVTRQVLLEKIWDANGNFVNDNTLTVTMKRLREKLIHREYIKTIRSFGYRMEEI